jgi:hypothetical protein
LISTGKRRTLQCSENVGIAGFNISAIYIQKMSESASEFASESKSETESIVVKRAYNVSDLKKEQLSKARARALELRETLNALKTPKNKPNKIKQPSKLEIEISKIKQQTKETELEPDKETEPEPENIIEPTKPPMEILKQQPQKKQGFQRDRQSGFFIL